MATVVFYLKQIVLLGTAGFAVFLGAAWWQFGMFWAIDTLQAWLFALLLVSAFLLLVATPLQLVCQSFAPGLALFVGFLSGPLAVAAALLLFSRYPFDLNSYVNRTIVLHSDFALIGFLFAFNFKRWLGPNNSFKPSPHQGGA